MKPKLFGLIAALSLASFGWGGAEIAARLSWQGTDQNYRSQSRYEATYAWAYQTLYIILGCQAIAGIGIVLFCWNPLKRQVVLQEVKKLDEKKQLSAGTAIDMEAALKMKEGNNG